MILLTRRYRFPAAHVLRSRALSDADNLRIFGKCANAAGHGHDYGVEVTVSGPLDSTTGQLVEVDRLDGVVQQEVLDRFGHSLLNDDPAFENAVPTAENLAQAVHDALAEPIASMSGARLVRIRIVETQRNLFDYGETL